MNSELAKFGLHNGGAQDAGLLNEKWESLALVPVEPQGHKDKHSKKAREYFLFSFSDNDFITQDGRFHEKFLLLEHKYADDIVFTRTGRMNFGRFKYADESGFNLDNQALVFRVRF